MKRPDLFWIAGRAGAAIRHEFIVDAHAHLGQAPDCPLIRPTAEELVKLMDRQGIRLACVSSINAIFGSAAMGNQTVAAALQAYPQRFFGYIVVDVGYPDRIAAQLQAGLKSGFRGLKVWSYGGRPGLPYDHPNYSSVFAFANKHRLPVLAHVFGPELDELEGHIRQYSDVRWLLAHVGSNQLGKYMQFAREFPSVYLELCLSSCPRGLIEHLVESGLEDKIIWGSDAMLFSQASQLGRVLFAQIPLAAKRKILGRNACRALALDHLK